eukprot:15347227-Heterocapsa_arctica.AAC.1
MKTRAERYPKGCWHRTKAGERKVETAGEQDNINEKDKDNAQHRMNIMRGKQSSGRTTAYKHIRGTSDEEEQQRRNIMDIQ